jgi:hypothetical protein
MVDFKQLKKSGSSIDKLTKAIADTQKQSYAKDDERFWQPEVDKAGNGYAVIRLLDSPAVDGDDGMPWARIFNHGFQGNGGWYIENCPTTVGGQCPVCEHNNKLWNSGIEANKETVRKQKRRLTYVSNILVVSDKNRPENEGKVFLWKYGKKIFDKIQEKLTPAFEDETSMNPFDFWKGANLKLKIRNVEGFRNYDKSEFEDSAPVYAEDKKIEELWKNLYSLKEFVAPKEFKSYDDLTDKLNRALGAGGALAARAVKTEDRTAPWDEPKSVEPRKTAEEVTVGDDDLDYFAKLAAE